MARFGIDFALLRIDVHSCVQLTANRLVASMVDGWRPFSLEDPLPFKCPPSLNALAVACCSSDPSRRPSVGHIIEALMGPCSAEAGEVESAELSRCAEARPSDGLSLENDEDARGESAVGISQGALELAALYRPSEEKATTNPMGPRGARTSTVISVDMSDV